MVTTMITATWQRLENVRHELNRFSQAWLDADGAPAPDAAGILADVVLSCWAEVEAVAPLVQGGQGQKDIAGLIRICEDFHEYAADLYAPSVPAATVTTAPAPDAPVIPWPVAPPTPDAPIVVPAPEPETEEEPEEVAADAPTPAPGRKLGRGYYTVIRPGGDYRTYRVHLQDKRPDRPPTLVVSLLTGPDNTGDYRQRVAYLDPDTLRVRWLHAAGDRNGWRQDIAALIDDTEAAGRRYAVASGNCYVCNRVLTTPESIAAGIGPKCAESGA